MSTHPFPESSLTRPSFSTPSAAPQTIAMNVMMTPTLAQSWLEQYRYPHQRPLRPHRVSVLAQEMRAGRFALTTIDLRTIENTGQTFLINGQHRLHAIIEAGLEIPMVVVRHRVDSMEAVARDYAVFDTHSKRSHKDALQAYDLTEETGLTLSQLRILGQTAPFLLSGFRISAVRRESLGQSPVERIDFIRAWANTAVLAFTSIGAAEHRRVNRIYNAGTFAVALVTMRYQPDKAERFWRRVAANDGLRQGEPEMKLVEYLTDYRAYNSRDPRLPRAVAACWNAAYEGRSLRLIKVNDPNGPIRIAGTPFKGTEHIILPPASEDA